MCAWFLSLSQLNPTKPYPTCDFASLVYAFSGMLVLTDPAAHAPVQVGRELLGSAEKSHTRRGPGFCGCAQVSVDMKVYGESADITTPRSTKPSTSKGTGCPDSSFLRSILVAQSMTAMLMKRELLARCIPAHCLRPKPYETWPSSFVYGRKAQCLQQHPDSVRGQNPPSSHHRSRGRGS